MSPKARPKSRVWTNCLDSKRQRKRKTYHAQQYRHKEKWNTNKIIVNDLNTDLPHNVDGLAGDWSVGRVGLESNYNFLQSAIIIVIYRRRTNSRQKVSPKGTRPSPKALLWFMRVVVVALKNLIAWVSYGAIIFDLNMNIIIIIKRSAFISCHLKRFPGSRDDEMLIELIWFGVLPGRTTLIDSFTFSPPILVTTNHCLFLF